LAVALAEHHPVDRGRRLLKAAECLPREGSEREHGRLPPHDVRGRDGCQRLRRDLAIGRGLIGVDLQEHVADVQGRALTICDDNLDLLHAGHHRGRRQMSPVYSRATAL